MMPLLDRHRMETGSRVKLALDAGGGEGGLNFGHWCGILDPLYNLVSFKSHHIIKIYYGSWREWLQVVLWEVYCLQCHTVDGMTTYLVIPAPIKDNQSQFSVTKSNDLFQHHPQGRK